VHFKFKERAMIEPSLDGKLWMIDKLADFINETKGQGTFRKMLEYLNMPYEATYLTGGMTISNALADGDDDEDTRTVTTFWK
jgi:hypothetical protein